jgi:hypothetical protein
MSNKNNFKKKKLKCIKNENLNLKKTKKNYFFLQNIEDDEKVDKMKKEKKLVENLKKKNFKEFFDKNMNFNSINLSTQSKFKDKIVKKKTENTLENCIIENTKITNLKIPNSIILFNIG